MNAATLTADEHGTYLLHVDFLGFNTLVEESGDVDGLFSMIDSLDAHNPDALETIVFSDAALVYAAVPPRNRVTRQHLVMYLCELAQELFYRLVGRDLYFRAYLTRGAFAHGCLENIDPLYGEPLVRARRRESEIHCTGLFIDNDSLQDCNVFLTTPYDSRCHFVHLMRSLDDVRFENLAYPIPAGLIVSRDVESLLAYDITYLRNVHANMNRQSLSPRIRVKYLSTWQMVRTRYRPLLDTLERNNFDPRCVADLDLNEAMRSVGTAEGSYG